MGSVNSSIISVSAETNTIQSWWLSSFFIIRVGAERLWRWTRTWINVLLLYLCRFNFCCWHHCYSCWLLFHLTNSIFMRWDPVKVPAQQNLVQSLSQCLVLKKKKKIFFEPSFSKCEAMNVVQDNCTRRDFIFSKIDQGTPIIILKLK